MNLSRLELILTSLLIVSFLPLKLFSKGMDTNNADSLAALLPEKLTTIVDKTLDDQFAKIEQSLSQLQNIDKKRIFLITLALENKFEDIYFPANKPVTIYPRAIFITIYEQLKLGKSKKEIARLLVKLQQKNGFKKIYLSRTHRRK